MRPRSRPRQLLELAPIRAEELAAAGAAVAEQVEDGDGGVPVRFREAGRPGAESVGPGDGEVGGGEVFFGGGGGGGGGVGWGGGGEGGGGGDGG